MPTPADVLKGETMMRHYKPISQQSNEEYDDGTSRLGGARVAPVKAEHHRIDAKTAIVLQAL